MKATGIVRKVDELGRVVLPIELRREFDINIRDPLEIEVDEDKIILFKHKAKCVFCGSTEDVRQKLEKTICQGCLSDIKNF